jgi:hypothetical protein
MHAAQPTLRFDAQLQVQVPRNTPGTLEEGVMEILERIDAVERVEDVDLQGLEPRLNDLTVHATVEGTLDLDRLDLDTHADSVAGGAEATRLDAAIAEQLEDGFGVAGAADIHLRRPAEDRGSPAMEYG